MMFSSSSGSGKKPPPSQVRDVTPAVSRKVPTDITCGLQEMVQVGTCPHCPTTAKEPLLSMLICESDCKLTAISSSCRPLRVSFAWHSIRGKAARLTTFTSSTSPFFRAGQRDTSMAGKKPAREPGLVVGASYSHADLLKFESLCAFPGHLAVVSLLTGAPGTCPAPAPDPEPPHPPPRIPSAEQ